MSSLALGGRIDYNTGRDGVGVSSTGRKNVRTNSPSLLVTISPSASMIVPPLASSM